MAMALGFLVLRPFCCKAVRCT